MFHHHTTNVVYHPTIVHEPYYPPYQTEMPMYYYASPHPFQPPRMRHPLLQAFINENGSFDFIKTAKTIDQVVKTASQVMPLVKQLQAIFSPPKGL